MVAMSVNTKADKMAAVKVAVMVDQMVALMAA